MKKKMIIALILCVLAIFFYVFIQFVKVNSVEKTCLTYEFNEVFKKENSFTLNKVYDFSEIFNCKNWDEIIIVGGKRENRAAIFLKEGVALPEINYSNRPSGSLLFYLIKDKKLISSPVEFWQSGFLYFNDFNSFDYVSLDREKAIFKCVELKTIGNDESPILTFELTTR